MIDRTHERNYRAIHEALSKVVKRHGIRFSEGPPIIRKGGVRVAEEAMMAKISDAVLLTEVERRGLLPSGRTGQLKVTRGSVLASGTRRSTIETFCAMHRLVSRYRSNQHIRLLRQISR